MDEPGDPWIRALLEEDPAAVDRRPGARRVKENPVRTVWRVPRDGGPAVYLKRFRVAPLDALKHLLVPSRARAEWEASRGLRAAGVPAVEVVGFSETRVHGLLRGASCAVAEFPDALELVPWIFRRFGREGPWTPAQAAERRDLLERLGRLLRAVHDAGWRHPDLHGGNLLVAREGTPPEIRLVDLHTVRPGAADRAGDLETLLHSLRTATSPGERDLLRAAYGGALGDPAARARFEDAIECREATRLASRTSRAKTFGPTGRFAAARRGALRILHLRSWGPEPFLAALDLHRRAAADPRSPDALKRGGRSTVTRVRVAGPGGAPVPLVVKETRVRGPLDLLKNALRRPRAMDSWAAGNGLWHRDIDCAEPRALLVDGAWPLRRASWIVMEDAADGGERFDLRSLRLWGGAPPDAAGRAAKRREILRLGAFLGGLHARGVYHGDLKAVNLFLRRKDGGDSFCLVDYDRVAFGRRPVPFRRRAKNLAQLAASLGTYFSRADRLRFYRAYAGRVAGAWEARREAAREVAAACARKIVVAREPIE